MPRAALIICGFADYYLRMPTAALIICGFANYYLHRELLDLAGYDEYNNGTIQDHPRMKVETERWFNMQRRCVTKFNDRLVSTSTS